MWSRLAAMRFKNFQFFWPDSPLAGLCLSAGSPRVFVWLVWLGPCAFALPCGLVAGRLGGLLNIIPEGNCGSSYFSAPRDNFKTRVAGAMHGEAEILRKSRPNPAEISPKSCGNLAQILRKCRPNPVEISPKSCGNLAQILRKSRPNPVEISPKSCGNLAQILRKSLQNPAEIWPKSCGNLARILPGFCSKPARGRHYRV